VLRSASMLDHFQCFHTSTLFVAAFYSQHKNVG
jgi:hypothetical protein